MPNSLGRRALLSFTTLLLVTLLVVGYILGTRAHDEAQRALVARLESSAVTVAAVGRLLLAGKLTADETASYAAALPPGTHAALVDTAGQLLLSLPRERALSTPTELQLALAGQRLQGLRDDAATGATLAYLALPIEDAGRIVGAARVALPAHLNAAPARIAATFALAALVLLVISALFWLWLSHTLNRALAHLAQVARRIASGQLEERADEPDIEELQPLTSAVNEMAASLESQVRQSVAERDTLGVVLDSMADALLVVDANGIITLANPAAVRLFGADSSTISGRRLMEVVRDHEFLRLVEAAEREGHHQLAQLEHGRDPRFLHVTATPIQQKGGRFTLLLAQDLTEVQRLEAVRREFVANASHELRTPLAAVKAVVETLEAGALEDPLVARDFLRRIGTEVDHLTLLVQQFLDLSRLETGRAHFTFEPVDLATLLPEAVNRLAPQAAKQGVQLAVAVPAGLPRARADRATLHEIIVNLVGNAIKFAPQGRVHVAAIERAGQLQVSVADNGQGIAAEHLPHIFERFYKVDRARSGEGTGLGLALAKHMVQAHQGRIWAESTLGRGSTFYFTLPSA